MPSPGISGRVSNSAFSNHQRIETEQKPSWSLKELLLYTAWTFDKYEMRSYELRCGKSNSRQSSLQQWTILGQAGCFCSCLRQVSTVLSAAADLAGWWCIDQDVSCCPQLEAFAQLWHLQFNEFKLGMTCQVELIKSVAGPRMWAQLLRFLL